MGVSWGVFIGTEPFKPVCVPFIYPSNGQSWYFLFSLVQGSSELVTLCHHATGSMSERDC